MLAKHLRFEVISKEEFLRSLRRYPEFIKSLSLSSKEVSNGKSTSGEKSLEILDKFRYDQAPKSFGSKDLNQAMGLEELKTMVEWKLRHGKFRPTLMKLVTSNSPTAVSSAISEALSTYHSAAPAGLPSAISKAVESISKPLKGVGPATASLVLSVHDPARVIFFSDEVFWWLCCGGRRDKIGYTAKGYRGLQEKAAELQQRLGVEALDVERVAYVVMREGGSDSKEKDGELPETGQGSDGRKTSGGPAEKTRGRKRNAGEEKGAEDSEATATLRRSKRGKAA